MASRKQRGWTVPGFGLPLRWPEMVSRRWQPLFQPDENTLLLSALDGSEDPKFCYTQRELTMLALINELTDMTEWDRRIFHPDVTFEWKSQKLLNGHDITRAMLDWCVEEVKYYIHDFIPSRIIPSLDGGVIKSDDCVDQLLNTDVHRAAASLRRAAAKGTGSSPGSVIDIVDPYLFPFAYEKTRVLRGGYIAPQECISSSGQGDPVWRPSDDECVERERAKYPNKHAYSNHSQWLPFDITFGNRSYSKPRISSYINNVHPITNHAFYNTLSHLIDTLLPLFNRTLVDLKAPGYQNQRFQLASLGREPMIKREPGPFQPPEQRARAQWLDHQGRYSDFIFVDLKREFWNIGLQMVLQMREINLAPDSSPTYEGEEWHITGQMNERVCATAHYVYSTENTTQATLAFRRRINPESAALASGHITTPPFAPKIYGAQDGDPAIQTLGSVTLREGRVVVYPNTFQSKLSAFSLADAAKPGHVRLLTLHLIDPNRRIMSTGMVPSQRRDWWADAVRKACPRLWQLPNEVWDRIVNAVDGWPLSMEEGLEMRREFMEEREEFRKQHTESMEKYLPWDLGGFDEDDE